MVFVLKKCIYCWCIRPDNLDEGLLRPGRLVQIIYILLPDLKSRLSIIKTILRKTPVDPKIPLDFV